jgi:hypothetical protein
MYLSTFYEATGKFGVTLFLIALGVVIILIGVMMDRPRYVELPVQKPAEAPQVPYLVTPVEQDDVETTYNGKYLLQTRKYLN